MASQQEEAPGLSEDQNVYVTHESGAGATDTTTTADIDTNRSDEATNLTTDLADLAVAENDQTVSTGDDHTAAVPHPYKEGEEEVMWHRIKAYLKNPVGPKPGITCSICREPLFIHGITPRPAEDKIEQLKTTVMICGHMFHHGCFGPLVRPGFRGLCPYCKQDMVLGCYCGEYENFAPTEPGEDPDDESRVMLTWPEGAERNGRCAECKAAGRKFWWSRLPEEDRTFHGVVMVDSDVEEENEEDEEDEEEDEEGEDSEEAH